MALLAYPVGVQAAQGLFKETVQRISSQNEQGFLGMSKKTTPDNDPPRLVKWRFEPNGKSDGAEAKYWWSDGKKTKEKVTSHLDAMARLKSIQDNGGMRTAD